MGITSIGCLHATHVGSVDHKQKASRPPPCGGDTSVTTGAEAVAVGGKHLTTELAPPTSHSPGLPASMGPSWPYGSARWAPCWSHQTRWLVTCLRITTSFWPGGKRMRPLKGVLELTGPSSWPSTGPNGGRCGGCAPPSSLSQAGSTPRKVCSELP